MSSVNNYAELLVVAPFVVVVGVKSSLFVEGNVGGVVVLVNMLCTNHTLQLNIECFQI
jgi:hypothetical protein